MRRTWSFSHERRACNPSGESIISAHLLRQHVAKHDHERISELEELRNLRLDWLSCSASELVLLLDPSTAFRSNGVILFVLISVFVR